jgi:dGTPase
VTRLERKYMAFDGLNLSFETLEGLAKHNGPVVDGPVWHTLAQAGLSAHLVLETQASLEAQAAAIADDIAYNNHDIDDGLRAGLLKLEDLVEVPMVGRFVKAALAMPSADRQRVIYEVNRRMITAMIEDVVGHARSALAGGADPSRDPLVVFSPDMAAELKGLKAYLFQHVYRHERVMRVMAGAESIVREVFQRYLDHPDDLPGARAAQVASLSREAGADEIANFVAGMTDRYAIAEHRRLFPTTPELR